MDFYTNLTFEVQKESGLGSRDPISKFRDPLITFERIELSASNMVQTSRTHPSGVRTIKLPISGRGLGLVTKFRNFGTPYNFGSNRDMCFKFDIGIDDGPLLRPDHKMTHKWACLGSRDPISKFCDPLITFERIKLSASNLVQTSTMHPSGVRYHKMTPKWAWPRSRDQISKFWDPL